MRADVRIPGGGRGGPSGQRVQHDLHRAERVEEIHIHIGDDVGRERERQRERPGERVAAGETIRGDEPCRAGSDDCGQRGDTREQQYGDAQGFWDHVSDEIGPDVGFARQRDTHKVQERNDDECRDDDEERACGEIGRRPEKTAPGRDARRRIGKIGRRHCLVIEPHLVDQCGGALLVLRDLGKR